MGSARGWAFLAWAMAKRSGLFYGPSNDVLCRLVVGRESGPFVAMAAFADLGIGVLYFFVQLLDLGSGRVVAVTHEYGNTFLVVSGLLNMLVVLDTFDTMLGRKP